jgi:hypothetical protein
MKRSDKKGMAQEGKTIKAPGTVKRKSAAGNGTAVKEAAEENKEEHMAGQVPDEGLSQMESLAFEVLDYAGKHKEQPDKALFIKGLATGILLLFGMRKSGIVGSIAVFAAAGIITRYIIDNAAQASYNGDKEK